MPTSGAYRPVRPILATDGEVMSRMDDQPALSVGVLRSRRMKRNGADMRPFARALNTAKARYESAHGRIAQAKIGEIVGVDQTTVGTWLLDNRVPERDNLAAVQRMEELFETEPGFLTRHLVERDEAVATSVATAIEDDPLLEQHEKAALLAHYDSYVRDRR